MDLSSRFSVAIKLKILSRSRRRSGEVVASALGQLPIEEREALACREILKGEGLPEKAIEYRLKKAGETR